MRKEQRSTLRIDLLLQLNTKNFLHDLPRSDVGHLPALPALITCQSVLLFELAIFFIAGVEDDEVGHHTNRTQLMEIAGNENSVFTDESRLKTLKKKLTSYNRRCR